MSTVAIIPARGGSKRLAHKNIRLFHGLPIIAYSIQAALSSDLFDTVMVSTDDPETAEIAQDFGASVPFGRSARTAGDTATLADVCQETLQRYQELGEQFSEFCCLLATAPFVEAPHLQRAQALMRQANYQSVFPIVPFSYPIQRALQLDKGQISLVQPEHLNTRSQDLPPRYHDAGLFYFAQTAAFLQQPRLIGDYSGGIVISELEAQDIDNETDWQLAEAKYQHMRFTHAQTA